jgi:hypothetical protein
MPIADMAVVIIPRLVSKSTLGPGLFRMLCEKTRTARQQQEYSAGSVGALTQSSGIAVARPWDGLKE